MDAGADTLAVGADPPPPVRLHAALVAAVNSWRRYVPSPTHSNLTFAVASFAKRRLFTLDTRFRPT